MLPADQRFHAGDVFAFRLDLRLIVDAQFAVLFGKAKFRFEREPLLMRFFRHRDVRLEIVAAHAFRAVHRDVGMLEQTFGAGRVVRIETDADARGHVQFGTVGERERHFHHAHDLLGDAHHVVALHDVAQDHREFVARVTRNRIRRAHAGAQAFGHRHQHLIADGMAERIVDVLEAVEIDEQRPQTFRRCGALP